MSSSFVINIISQKTNDQGVLVLDKIDNKLAIGKAELNDTLSAIFLEHFPDEPVMLEKVLFSDLVTDNIDKKYRPHMFVSNQTALSAIKKAERMSLKDNLSKYSLADYLLTNFSIFRLIGDDFFSDFLHQGTLKIAYQEVV